MSRLTVVIFIGLLFCVSSPLCAEVDIGYVRLNEANKPSAVQIWNATWGCSGKDMGMSLSVYEDYIYVVAYAEIFGTNGDTVILKYDLNGKLIWNISLESIGPVFGRDILVYNDYIYMLGEKYANETYWDIYVAKLDLEGNKIWESTWGGRKLDYGYALYAYDNSIYVVGSSENISAKISDIVLIRFNSDGNIVWNTTWSGDGLDFGYDIFVYGNAIYVVGTTKKSENNDDIILLKYDLNSYLLWNVTWGGEHLEDGFGIHVYRGYIYVVGSTNEENEAGDVVLLKYDCDGNLIWTTTWGGVSSDIGRSIYVEKDCIYITGETISFGARIDDIFILKYDIEGNYIWNVTWGGANDDDPHGIVVNSGYIYIVGETYSFGAGDSDVFLIKFDNDDDGDGLGNHEEGIIGTDPNDPDTDNDGYSDWDEIVSNTDPLDPKDNPRSKLLKKLAIILSLIIAITIVFVIYYKLIKPKKLSQQN